MHVVNIAPMADADLDEVSELLRNCFGWLADQEGFHGCDCAFLTGERSSAETVREESKGGRIWWLVMRVGRCWGWPPFVGMC